MTSPIPATPASLPPLNDWSYRAVWKRLPRGLGYLVPTFLIAITVSAVLNSIFSTGLSLLIIVVGLFLIAATLFLARFAGTFEVMRLRWSGLALTISPIWPCRTSAGDRAPVAASSNKIFTSRARASRLLMR